MIKPKSLKWVIAALLFVLVLVPCVQAESYSYVTQWDSSGSCDGRFNLPYAVAVDTSGNVYVADTSNHRIQKFSSDGTFETKWGTSGSGDGQFNFPEGVAVDSSGNVYVADKSNNRIQKFDSTGAFLGKWGTSGSGDGQFNFPHGIAVDSSGNVYVADTSNNRIQKFDSSGAFITKWGSLGSNDGQFSFPEGVAVDSSGNVYVSDWQNDRIQKFDSSGTFLGKWGSHGSGDGQLNYPEGIAVDSSGNVYVVDAQNHRIQKFSSTGVFATTWGSDGSGNGQFHFPQGVAVDSSGNVYVADPYNYRIQKFTSDGTYVTQWGSYGMGDGRFTYPYGIAVDTSGNVYVADTGNNRIQEFTSGGTFGTMWGSYGSAIGQFDTPNGIAVDSADNRYVADSNHHRIQKFSPGTTTTVLSGGPGFTQPKGVAVDASGTVYIADTYNDRVQKFASDGTYVKTWGSTGTGDGKFIQPVGIAADSSYVYVVDASNNEVQKFTSDGTFVMRWGTFGSGNGQFMSPRGIAVDSAGNVFITDPGNARIQKFTSDGTYLTQWGSSGSGDGQFNVPAGIAVDTAGNVYVADSNNHRIQKFAPSGSIHVTSAPSGAYIAIDYSQMAVFTESTIYDIPPGSHDVTVWVDHYVPQTKSVTVTGGDTVDVSFTLAEAPPAPSSPGWKFHSDAENTGLYVDASGEYPANTVKWSFTTGGAVRSSPAVVDDVVYISSHDGNVYALDANTGAKIWEHQTSDTSPGRSSPAVVNGVVYIGSTDTNVYALDAADGHEIWKYWTAWGNGIYSSPTVVNGVVYVGTAAADSRVYALDAVTGTRIWSTKQFGDSILSSPAVAGGRVYVGCMDHKVYALNANTGETEWEFVTGGAIQSSPMVADGTVYIGSGAPDSKIYALDAGTGTKIWEFAAANSVVSTPALYGEWVIAGGGSSLYALNRDSGLQEWTYTASLLYSSPAVANDRVYIGASDNKVYALDAGDGTEIWTYTTGNQILYSSPAIADGVLYIGSDDGKVYAFGETSAVPTADYTVDTYFGVSPLTVIFTDTSTGIPTPPTSVSIDFGDGDSADIIPRGTSVSHTYSSPGTYMPVITACNGGGGCDSQTKATISAIYSGLDPGLVAACKLTLDEKLNGNAVDKLMFGQELGQGPKTLELFGGESFELPDEAGYLISIDFFPQANYEHKIVFAYVSKTDPMVILKIIETSSPSTNYANPILIVGVPPEPAGFTSGPTLFTAGSNSLTGGGGGAEALTLQAANAIPMCAPDCSHYYALLLSGGVQKEYNYARYRNDIAFLYTTLKDKYGYPESHITVLMSDGTNSEYDQIASYTDNTPNYANSITDFDNDQSPEVKDTPVTRTNVINTLRELRDTLEPEDNLFIFTTNHGGLITDPSIPDPTSKEVILYLWGTTDEGWITDEEFVNELPGSPLYPGTGINSITMVMEQCFSGGFIDNFIGQYQGPEQRMIATAADWNEYSWGNAYSFQWISGVDGNRYSMQEAHDNARNNDMYYTQYSPPKENPQFSSYPTPDVGTSQYLAECSVTPSIDVTAPGTATWYTTQTRPIEWTQVGLSGKTVNIELWKGTAPLETMVLPIATVLLNDELKGSTQWTIPSTLAAGREYWIKIYETETSVSDRSDGTITINRARAGTTPTGKLWVNSTPVPTQGNVGGAMIYIDKELQKHPVTGAYNLTNSSVWLPSGSHYVGVEREGYYPVQFTTVDVPLGGTKSQNFPLEPIISGDPQNAKNDCAPYGIMGISSTPVRDAKITILDQDTLKEIKGYFTNTNTKIAPGKYTVTAEHDGFLTMTETDVEIAKPDCNNPYRQQRVVSVAFDLTPIQPSLTCLWPPDNTFVDLTINGPDGNPMALTVTKITSDEPTITGNAPGEAKFTPDAVIINGGAAFKVRAERSGAGDGRVYRITTIDTTGVESAVPVCVPHDPTNEGDICECNDSGQNYDATKK